MGRSLAEPQADGIGRRVELQALESQCGSEWVDFGGIGGGSAVHGTSAHAQLLDLHVDTRHLSSQSVNSGRDSEERIDAVSVGHEARIGTEVELASRHGQMAQIAQRGIEAVDAHVAAGIDAVEIVAGQVGRTQADVGVGIDEAAEGGGDFGQRDSAFEMSRDERIGQIALCREGSEEMKPLAIGLYLTDIYERSRRISAIETERSLQFEIVDLPVFVADMRLGHRERCRESREHRVGQHPWAQQFSFSLDSQRGMERSAERARRLGEMGQQPLHRDGRRAGREGAEQRIAVERRIGRKSDADAVKGHGEVGDGDGERPLAVP